MTKAQTTIVTVLLAALLAVAAGHLFLDYKQFREGRDVRWEYRVEVIPDANFAAELDQLGDMGWELTFARRALSGEGSSAKGIYECIFKREKVAITELQNGK